MQFRFVFSTPLRDETSSGNALYSVQLDKRITRSFYIVVIRSKHSVDAHNLWVKVIVHF